MNERVCVSCGEAKPETTEYFYAHPGSLGGLKRRCKACIKQYRQDNKERDQAKIREWHAANRDRVQEYRREYYQSNAELVKARARAWTAAHVDDPAAVARRRAYQQKRLAEHPELNRAKEDKRRFAMADRTVCTDMPMAWFVREAKELAVQRARLCGGRWEIDHVLPLQGELVSGLHIPENMQVVPARFNARKGCSYSPDIAEQRFLGGYEN